ncbi:MAG: hypothetical protein LJF04_05005 [Gemmatimonadetes bacterium]|jgi:hypothetical protein|nr:hypothetical protein [Gemmatimonadota bacterium]
MRKANLTAALVWVLSVATACGGKDSTGPNPPPTPPEPPYSGTIFIDPDIITSSDPTTYQGLTYAGQESRTMFDRRVNDWVTVDAYLFDVSFDDGLSTEVDVNPEFGDTATARAVADKYSDVIGRLPTALRRNVDNVWIHKGTQPFGGGNHSLLIHVGQADSYEADGILEETLVHEATHTSLDSLVTADPDWQTAQNGDGTFISTYARDNPTREDVAESFLPYLAIRYRADRISKGMADTIKATIPHRIDFFDQLSLDVHPIN